MTQPIDIDSGFENSDWIKRADPKAQAADIAATEEALRKHNATPPAAIQKMFEAEKARGNWGHAGIPGHLGGSAPRGGMRVFGEMGDSEVGAFMQDIEDGKHLSLDRTQGDAKLAYLASQRGYDGQPTAMDSDEFNSEIESGDAQELWRGVTGTMNKDASSMHRDFIDGEAFYGTGTYGNGMYFTPEHGKVGTYSNSSNSAVIHAGVRSNAKLVQGTELMKMYDAEVVHLTTTKGAGYAKRWSNIFDLATFAVYKGYDGILCKPFATHVNMLNRTALIVEKIP